MPQTQTVLTSHESKSGNKNGPWTLHIFKNDNGESFQTFETAIGNKAFGLLNQPIDLAYTPKQRGEHTNNVIDAIQPVLSNEVPAAGGAAQVTRVADPVSSGAVAPTDTISAKDTQIHRQSGLKIALDLHNAGLTDTQTLEDVVALSRDLADYFATGNFGVEVDLGFEA